MAPPDKTAALSLSRQLTRYVLQTSASIVVLVFLSVTVFNFYRQTRQLRAEMISLADLVGSNCRVALVFDLPSDAQQALDELKHREDFEAAAITDLHGHHFAGYSKLPAWKPERPLDGPSFNMTARAMETHRPILNKGQTIGWIHLRYNLSSFYLQRLIDFSLLLGILSLATAATYSQSRRWRRRIVDPIEGLAQTADQVTLGGDYGVRAPESAIEEIRRLETAFNNMLDQIGEQSKLLERERNFLDQIVHGSPVPIIRLDRNSQVWFANPAAYYALNLPPEEVLGRNWWRLTGLHSDKSPLRPSEAEPGVHIGETPLHPSDGPKRWMQWRMVDLGPDGPVSNDRLLFGFDITDRTESERRMRQLTEFQSLLNEVSQQFIASPREEIDAVLQEGLEKVCHRLGIQGGLIYEPDSQGEFADMALHWIEGEPRVEDPGLLRLHIGMMPRIQEILHTHRWQIADASQPPLSAAGMEIMARLGMTSLVAHSHGSDSHGGRIYGFFSRVPGWEWTNEHFLVLDIATKVFGGLLDRRDTEVRARSLAEFENLLNAISQRFLACPFEVMDNELTLAQEEICRHIGAQGVFVYWPEGDSDYYRLQGRWFQDSHPATWDSFSRFPLMRVKPLCDLVRAHSWEVIDLHRRPPQSETGHRMLAALGATSLMGIFQGNPERPGSFTAFFSRQHGKEWTHDEQLLLDMASKVLENLFARRDSERRMRFLTEFEAMLADMAQKAISGRREEISGHMTGLMEQACQMLGLRAASLQSVDSGTITLDAYWMDQGIDFDPSPFRQIALEGMGNLSEIVQSQTQHVMDIEVNPPDSPPVLEVAGQLGFKSCLLIVNAPGGQTGSIVTFYSWTPGRAWLEEEKLALDMAAKSLLHMQDRLRSEEALASLQQQVIQSQKLEAVGTLAGGIAHDFNNLLGVILGNAELLLEEDHFSTPDSREDMKYLYQAALRGRDLVRQILMFSRKEAPRKERLDIVQTIRDAGRMMKSLLPASTPLAQVLPSDPVWVEGDASQLQQIIVNLISNAAHAVGRAGNIRLEGRLETGASAPQFLLAVEDDGTGITLEHLDRIFDPFFTTKKIGEGTGLGLSVVHGIVQSHGGTIQVESTPGRGARFEIRLPVQISAATPGVAADEMALPRFEGRVLLVDDDSSQQRTLQRMLEKFGLEVEAFTQAQSALEKFTMHPGSFKIVVTDWVMPGISGDRLAEALWKIRPECRIIMVTGSHDTESLARFRVGRPQHFRLISKPVSAGDLAGAISSFRA